MTADRVQIMSDTAQDLVSYTVDDHQVAAIVLDDGKANAISHAVIDDLNGALDRAQEEARAVVLVGRPGKFCAGFDLSVMTEGIEAAQALVKRGAELSLRIYEYPMPVVVACTGHALAMGAIMLMAADVRVGADGEYKIGLNEVSIGMPVPVFATELARDRLSKRHFLKAVSHSTIYSPLGAIDAGFLDEVAAPDDVATEAHHRARQLADYLKPDAFRHTRTNARAVVAQYIRDTLDADMRGFEVKPG
jgi:enoyl-CoA hydratase